MRIFLFLRVLVFLYLFTFTTGCRNGEHNIETSADIYHYYKVEEGAKILKVPPGLVSVFLDDDQAGNKEIKEILSTVDHLTFLVIPNNSEVKESEHFYSINKDFESINFQELAMINNGKEIIRLKVDKDSQQVDELIVLVSNYSNLFCVSFKGNISMESIIKLSKPENITAISNLNMLPR